MDQCRLFWVSVGQCGLVWVSSDQFELVWLSVSQCVQCESDWVNISY